MTDDFVMGMAVVVWVLALFAGPLLLIWSLNTLFGLDIPYTIWTWLAAGILMWTFIGATRRTKGD